MKLPGESNGSYIQRLLKKDREVQKKKREKQKKKGKKLSRYEIDTYSVAKKYPHIRKRK